MTRAATTLVMALIAAHLGCTSQEASTDVPDASGVRDGARDAWSTRDSTAPLPDVLAIDARAPEPPDARAGELLRDRHPGDVGMADDPAVLFFDDFEEGWGRWDEPRSDTAHLFVESGGDAHAGSRFLRSTVTHEQLIGDEYISASPHIELARRVPEIYWRLYARFVGVSPQPHHWIRTSAGTPAFASSGLANTVPDGDEGFWFDFDASLERRFSFYVYWHRMRSGRCNDGTATPGCAGDQGTTYYYGNTFTPPDQGAFVRDAWICIEIAGGVNEVGTNDGWLSAWIDDAPIGEFAAGVPEGTWLRDQFWPGGCSFGSCTAPVPFEGFDFRSSDDVLFKEIFLDAYYELGSWERTRDALADMGLSVEDRSTILYDDIVVATERIGCRR